MGIGTRRWTTCLVAASALASLLLQPAIAQRVAFTRGEQVREKIATPAGEPKRVGMVVTVVAEPGDQIETSETTIRVNGQPIAGFSAELIATAARSPRMPDWMPQDQYMVMGESRDPLNNVVRKWGIYPSRDLERAAD